MRYWLAEHFGSGHDARVLDHVEQLSHVAGPIDLAQLQQRGFADCATRPSAPTPQETVDQKRMSPRRSPSEGTRMLMTERR
jgi:hypothetical protein